MSDKTIKSIRAWMAKDTKRNTSMRLSTALGYQSNVVYVWLKKDRIPFLRLEPFIKEILGRLKSE